MFENKLLRFFKKSFGDKEDGLELRTKTFINLVSSHKKLKLPDSVLEQTQNIIVSLLEGLIEVIGDRIVNEQGLLNKLEPSEVRSQNMIVGIKNIERRIARYRKVRKKYELELIDIRQSKSDNNPIQNDLSGKLNQGILNTIYQIKYLVGNGQIEDSVEETIELFPSWKDKKQLEKILKKQEINRKQELLGLVTTSQAKVNRIEIQLELLNILDIYVDRAK